VKRARNIITTKEKLDCNVSPEFKDNAYFRIFNFFRFQKSVFSEDQIEKKVFFMMKGSPSSLYVTSVRRVAQNFERFASLDLSSLLTESMRFDIYWDFFTLTSAVKDSARCKYRHRRLARELGKLNVFFSLLNVGHRRIELHNMFQVSCHNQMFSLTCRFRSFLLLDRFPILKLKD
jgi:hypothetical protein